MFYLGFVSEKKVNFDPFVTELPNSVDNLANSQRITSTYLINRRNPSPSSNHAEFLVSLSVLSVELPSPSAGVEDSNDPVALVDESTAGAFHVDHVSDVDFIEELGHFAALGEFRVVVGVVDFYEQLDFAFELD